MCVYLVLSAPPQLTLPEKYSSPVTIDRGQDIVIKIPFTGHPKPKAKWFKDGQELKTGTLIYQTIDSFMWHSFVTFTGFNIWMFQVTSKLGKT